MHSREEMIDLWLFSKLYVINEPAKIIIPDGTTLVVEIPWSLESQTVPGSNPGSTLCQLCDLERRVESLNL